MRDSWSTKFGWEKNACRFSPSNAYIEFLSPGAPQPLRRLGVSGPDHMPTFRTLFSEVWPPCKLKWREWALAMHYFTLGPKSQTILSSWYSSWISRFTFEHGYDLLYISQMSCNMSMIYDIFTSLRNGNRPHRNLYKYKGEMVHWWKPSWCWNAEHSAEQTWLVWEMLAMRVGLSLSTSTCIVYICIYIYTICRLVDYEFDSHV